MLLNWQETQTAPSMWCREMKENSDIIHNGLAQAKLNLIGDIDICRRTKPPKMIYVIIFREMVQKHLPRF